ncbi:MAG: MotA/TolQ/ExbB proton channel family protein [Pirellulaceae bacterium]
MRNLHCVMYLLRPPLFVVGLAAWLCLSASDARGQAVDPADPFGAAPTSSATQGQPQPAAPSPTNSTAGAAAPVNNPVNAGAVPTAPPARSNTKSVLDALMDGGIVGLLIMCLSLVSVGMVIEHALSIRKSAVMPEAFLAEVEPLIASGSIDQAIEVCYDPANESLAANVVLAGLERYRGSQFGFAEYKSAVEEAGEDQTGRLYRKTEVLGLIGAVSPMLGLTGTVLGMIVAFNTIADSGGMAKPDELADGISQALVTTLLGLIVAIPTMVAYSFFRNRIDSLVSEAGNRIERIMMPLGRRGT